jgi:hypothetical protein
MAKVKSNKRVWRFFRSGGLDQVKLESGADLLALESLDQKLWVALACPAKGLDFDTKTLAYVDADNDGRIRVPELLAAVKWTGAVLKNPDDLLDGSPSLPLAAINEASPEAAGLLPAARQILADCGTPQAETVSAEQTADALSRFLASPLNGDGVLVAEAVTEPAHQAAFKDLLACLPGESDRNGKPGLSQASLEKFFGEARAYSAWWEQSGADAAILPLGGDTAAAFDAVAAVRSKVEDFFTRCRICAFDGRAAAALNREEGDYLRFTNRELAAADADIAAFPLSRVEPGKALPLGGGINPAWAGQIQKLRDSAVTPLLGAATSLSEDDWRTLLSRLAAYETWQAGKAGALVEKLGIERVRQILAGGHEAALMALIAADKAQESHATAIAAIDKLVHFHRDLYRLCVNFVNFKSFYSPESTAIFQAGTLFLDQRSCQLCLQIQDAAKHAGIAAMAGVYLVYCDCTRKGSAEKMQIVAAMTDGDSENLMLGRNGVFYDSKGQDWDAVITKIIENPISLRQAFWSPYKGFVRMIETQIAKRAAAADTAATSKLQTAAVATASADQLKAPPAPAKKIDVGAVAALGVAVGAIGTFFATILGYLTGIVKLGPLAIIGALAGLILLISGPSLILAFIKLRKRNLGPILDGNGWAINARAKITVPLGAQLTQVAKLPAGAQRDLLDPFAEKKSPWPRLVAAAVLLYIAYAALDHTGFIYTWSKGRIGLHKGIHSELQTQEVQIPQSTR